MTAIELQTTVYVRQVSAHDTASGRRTWDTAYANDELQEYLSCYIRLRSTLFDLRT